MFTDPIYDDNDKAEDDVDDNDDDDASGGNDEDSDDNDVSMFEACVAPNGTTMALGDSVFIDPVWYSCYRWGKMKNPIDSEWNLQHKDR